MRSRIVQEIIKEELTRLIRYNKKRGIDDESIAHFFEVPIDFVKSVPLEEEHNEE